MDSLNIGKVIYNILQADKDVVSLVDKKIYPLIADEGTTFPFLIYRRAGITPEGTKDNSNENVLLELTIAADNYAQSVDLAIKARKALEHKKGTFSNIAIDDIVIQDATEDYLEDTFIQNLTFKIDIQ